MSRRTLIKRGKLRRDRLRLFIKVTQAALALARDNVHNPDKLRHIERLVIRKTNHINRKLQKPKYRRVPSINHPYRVSWRFA